MRCILVTGFACVVWAESAIDRAVKYLAAEVPRWRVENGCFSCHNNGDAARALYAARMLEPAQSTTQWLTSPAEWDKGKADAAYSDKTLALYQFAGALTAAVESGAVQDRTSLVEAAKRLAAVQQADGSWRVDDQGDAAGSPVTWGTTLATYFGRRTMLAAGGFDEAVARASAWLKKTQPRYLLDEAAVLLAFPEDRAIRTRAVARFATAQTSDGGWGPRQNAAAEVFDTAMVLLALSAAKETALVEAAREFLLRTQQPSGGWPETTRPSGSHSYAQHISTTAWATMALLATDGNRK